MTASDPSKRQNRNEIATGMAFWTEKKAVKTITRAIRIIAAIGSSKVEHVGARDTLVLSTLQERLYDLISF